MPESKSEYASAGFFQQKQGIAITPGQEKSVQDGILDLVRQLEEALAGKVSLGNDYGKLHELVTDLNVSSNLMVEKAKMAQYDKITLFKQKLKQATEPDAGAKAETSTKPSN